MLTLVLDSPEATMRLGGLLGRALGQCPLGVWPALYLFGDLGGGKTTLVRGLVAALPGGDEAEVASPSFTLCNEYPTRPPMLHADLYRLSEGSALPEELEEAADGHVLLALEWPERLAPPARARDRLDVALAPYGADPAENLDILSQPCERKRLARLAAHGELARRLLDGLRPVLEARFSVAEPQADPSARAPGPC